MRRMFALAAVIAAVAAPAVPARAAVVYDRECGGILDAQCQGRVCPMDCFSNPCLVWIDPLHSPFSAICVPPVVQAG